MLLFFVDPDQGDEQMLSFSLASDTAQAAVESRIQVHSLSVQLTGNTGFGTNSADNNQ